MGGAQMGLLSALSSGAWIVALLSLLAMAAACVAYSRLSVWMWVLAGGLALELVASAGQWGIVALLRQGLAAGAGTGVNTWMLLNAASAGASTIGHLVVAVAFVLTCVDLARQTAPLRPPQL